MFRALPPSGVPIKFTDILAGFGGIFSGEKSITRFNQGICRTFGVRHSFTVSSGRAGLSLLFRALQKLHPARNEVLIPAFTSFSVPSAVVNAGLLVSLYDVDPATLSPVSSSIAITEKTLCIVVCHLFGYPADLDNVLTIAKERQIPVIDDAAQAMGAFYNGKPVGTFGYAGLFSLSRGKNITAVDGGIVVTNDDSLAEAIAAVDLGPVGFKDYAMLMLKAIILSFLLHPRCYWLPRSIPALNIGASHFNPHFAVQRFTAFQAGIAQRMLNRMDQINSARRRVAEKLTRLLSGNKAVAMPQVVIGCQPVFLRFPVIGHLSVEHPKIGIVRSYPAAIQHIPGIEPYLVTHQNFPGAELLAERILTLPTHCYVTDDDCEIAVKAVS
jgi:dTDP-4-amino-4,6-dideoxygalactose transaminase